jgi:hypothetical protein
MPLSENPPQQPTSLVLHFTDLTPQAIAVLQALGFGGAGVGKPVTGAGANKVLFTDDSGNLQVSNNFKYKDSSSFPQLYFKKASGNPSGFTYPIVIESASDEPSDSGAILFYNPISGQTLEISHRVGRTLQTRASVYLLDSGATDLVTLNLFNNNNPRVDVVTTNSLAKLLQLKQAANHTADAIAVLDSSDNPMFRVLPSGGIAQNKTITPNGTTGNQTINKPLGTVNIAAGQSSVTVTNSLVDANSIVFAVVRTNDSTAQIKNVTCAAGSFTIRLAANATAETSIGFMVMN